MTMRDVSSNDDQFKKSIINYIITELTKGLEILDIIQLLKELFFSTLQLEVINAKLSAYILTKIQLSKYDLQIIFNDRFLNDYQTLLVHGFIRGNNTKHKKYIPVYIKDIIAKYYIKCDTWTEHIDSMIKEDIQYQQDLLSIEKLSTYIGILSPVCQYYMYPKKTIVRRFMQTFIKIGSYHVIRDVLIQPHEIRYSNLQMTVPNKDLALLAMNLDKMFQTNEISLYDYTEIILEYLEICQDPIMDPYSIFDKAFKEIILKNYIKSINEKFNHDYKMLITNANNKEFLSIVYKLFKKKSEEEAKKLNQEFSTSQQK